MSAFEFLGEWEIVIKLRYDQALGYLTVNAAGVSEETDGIFHGFHFHPNIKESARWTCLDAYEKGPHFHLNSSRDVKIFFDSSVLPLENFLLFLVGRHHKSRYRKVAKLCGRIRPMNYGLIATAG
ncbi:MAG: hypothetical protein HC902_00790 [Calothrix sp. SM1_5_4]|nr:hypothetical protein [Calothrix sp. SM1_5_4]